MGRAAVRARMKGRACQGLGRRGYAHRSSTTDLERESKSAFLPKENCNRQQTTTRTPAPPLIRNASAKPSRPGRGRPGVAPAGSVYGAVISGRFCVDQDLNIDLGPKSESGPGFDTDHMSVWREGETPQHKWSLGQRPVLSAWKHAPFFEGQTSPKSPQNVGSNPFILPHAARS